MLIGKNWKIEADSLNITLYKRHIVKAKAGKLKNIYWSVEGYYSNIKNALKALVDYEVAETGLEDFRTISQKQEELYKLIETLNLVAEVKLSVKKQDKGKTIAR